jgi:hypothetical protein
VIPRPLFFVPFKSGRILGYFHDFVKRGKDLAPLHSKRIHWHDLFSQDREGFFQGCPKGNLTPNTGPDVYVDLKIDTPPYFGESLYRPAINNVLKFSGGRVLRSRELGATPKKALAPTLEKFVIRNIWGKRKGARGKGVV